MKRWTTLAVGLLLAAATAQGAAMHNAMRIRFFGPDLRLGHELVTKVRTGLLT